MSGARSSAAQSVRPGASPPDELSDLRETLLRPRFLDRVGATVGDRRITAVATAAVGEVYDEILDLFTRHGRSQAVVRLRWRAQKLAASASARDQIRSCTFAAAADDLAAERAALAQWRAFTPRDHNPTEEARRRVRTSIPRLAFYTVGARALAQTLSASVAGQGRGDPQFELGPRLLEEAQLQLSLWDDPRIPADGSTRALMYAAGRLIEARSARRPHRLTLVALRMVRALTGWLRKSA
jgi:hypothetical protein